MAKNLLEAIADPVRLRLLRTLARRGGMTIGELAEVAGVHANTARSHLAALEQEQVVRRERQRPSGLRGRPRVRYTLTQGWRLPTTDMSALAELLAALALRSVPAERSDELGLRWGRYLAGRPGSDAEGNLGLALERLGFDHEHSGPCLRLSSCPCPLVAPGQPQLICHLVQAVIEGMLDMRDPPQRIAASQHDPVRRTCTMTIAPATADAGAF